MTPHGWPAALIAARCRTCKSPGHRQGLAIPKPKSPVSFAGGPLAAGTSPRAHTGEHNSPQSLQPN
eukprot:10409126-Alexandrium_andersonii.AAC.1